MRGPQRKPRSLCFCGQPASRTRGKYCSQAHAGQAKQRRGLSVCDYAPCGMKLERPLSWSSRSGLKFCSSEHRDAWRRSQRPEYLCAQCGTRPRPARGKYCSRDCSAEAQRTHVTRVCAICPARFVVYQRSIKRGWGTYCSWACHNEARRRSGSEGFACARCGVTRRVRRSAARKRQYCSRACAAEARRTWSEQICMACSEPFLVRQATIARGWGKYCTRTCYSEARRARRLELECQRRGCWRKFLVFPSQAGRKYCRWRCYILAQAPRTFRCLACKETRSRPLGKHPTFCSGACRNRGRRRERSLALAERNCRILELYTQGMKVPVILKQLSMDRDDWRGITIWAIHKVIAREGSVH
jgi:hypothetical protein